MESKLHPTSGVAVSVVRHSNIPFANALALYDLHLAAADAPKLGGPISMHAHRPWISRTYEASRSFGTEQSGSGSAPQPTTTALHLFSTALCAARPESPPSLFPACLTSRTRAET